MQSDVAHITLRPERNARHSAAKHRTGSAARLEKGSSPPPERTVHSTAVVDGPGECHRLAAAESYGPAADVPLRATDTFVPFRS
jgi:hypothetical protein